MHYNRASLAGVRSQHGYIVSELIEDLQDAYAENDGQAKEIKDLEKEVSRLEKENAQLERQLKDSEK